MGETQLLDGGTVRLGGVGTTYHYTGVSLFYVESTAGGCMPPGVAHPRWRKTQVQASPNVSTILVTVVQFPTLSTFLFLDLGIGGHSRSVPVG